MPRTKSLSQPAQLEPMPAVAVTAQPLAVTPSQAAAMLGVQQRTLEIWRKEKRGPRYLRLGDKRSRVLYRVRDLEAWLDSHLVDVEAGE